MKYRLILASAGALVLVAALAYGHASSQSAAPQPGLSAPPAAPAAATPDAKVDPEKEKAIKQLMELTGSSKDGDNMTTLLTNQVKKVASGGMNGDRLQKFVDDFSSKLNTKSPANQVMDAEVAIYAQNFTIEDLHGMIQFYQSPVGQHVMKALPTVLQQTQQQGYTIERAAAFSTLKEMTGDYPEIKSIFHEEQKPSLGGTTGQASPQPKPDAQQPKPQVQQPQQPQQ